ncbi:DUF4870 domain-containing protein [Microbacterium sp.]|uniref:DUF4870 domain-containing protein n=1 Tax=Microbacterium sp. TaxID=51671 RepID=UPI003A883AAD
MMTRPATGSLTWGLGFLGFIPIPFFSLLIVAIVAIVASAVYPSQRRHGPIAEGNARNAANWAWTAFLVLVLSVVLTTLLVALQNFYTPGPFPGRLPFLVLLGVGITHPVLCIMGLVAASKGQGLRVPYAIPFIRAAWG